MPIDYTTALGQVRLLIADVGTAPILDDPQISGYLAMHGITQADTKDAATWAVKRAAADALSAIATSEALIGKVIRTQDLTTDGAKVATELRAQATALREQAKADEEAAGAEDDEGVFLAAEFSPYPSRW